MCCIIDLPNSGCSGLIRGPLGSGVPSDVGFAADYEHGALLSVAWSSGIITFYPFLFS